MIQEQLIKKEKFTSIQEVQAGLTNILNEAKKEGNFYRVLRNNKPLGVLLPNNVWESLLEDLEAINSVNYLQSIQEARRSVKLISSDEVKRQLNLK
ncbi:type II toxin-antitoxin system Phd/YefM family antitoxin [candidate division WWE3 bacterium]|nr:type II toxin-antitoxin system Phd/YefM family antitoxin [candidate division WWE3 bacterium]